MYSDHKKSNLCWSWLSVVCALKPCQRPRPLAGRAHLPIPGRSEHWAQWTWSTGLVSVAQYKLKRCQEHKSHDVSVNNPDTEHHLGRPTKCQLIFSYPIEHWIMNYPSKMIVWTLEILESLDNHAELSSNNDHDTWIMTLETSNGNPHQDNGGPRGQLQWWRHRVHYTLLRVIWWHGQCWHPHCRRQLN